MRRKGTTSEAIKIALAILTGILIFAVILGFAEGPQDAEEDISRIGEGLLSYAENASLEISEY